MTLVKSQTRIISRLSYKESAIVPCHEYTHVTVIKPQNIGGTMISLKHAQTALKRDEATQDYEPKEKEVSRVMNMSKRLPQLSNLQGRHSEHSSAKTKMNVGRLFVKR